MRVSREQMAENRRRILDVASRLFRAKGFDAVSLSEVMKAAGLTHGGFYGYFSSKDDLVAQALAHTLAADSHIGGDFRGYLDTYLSPRHLDDPAGGCPTAVLAPARHGARAIGVVAHAERRGADAVGRARADDRPCRAQDEG